MLCGNVGSHRVLMGLVGPRCPSLVIVQHVTWQAGGFEFAESWTGPEAMGREGFQSRVPVSISAGEFAWCGPVPTRINLVGLWYDFLGKRVCQVQCR